MHLWSRRSRRRQLLMVHPPCYSSPIPKNLRCFKRNEGLRMTRNDPGCEVGRRSVRADYRRVAPGVFARKRFSPNHGMTNRIAAVERFGIEFHLDRIRIESFQVNLRLEMMLFSLGLHLHRAEPYSGPVIGDLTAPFQQTFGSSVFIRAAPLISRRQRYIMFVGVLSHASRGGECRRKAGHALAHTMDPGER